VADQNSLKFKRFGKFLLLDHLVDGGMAKIWRARMLDEQTSKVVAIKMVHSQYSADENFKTMFMNEIKVTLGLNHPNIIQTFDYGYHENQLYVVMEYCDGKNLKQYLDKIQSQGEILPQALAVYITTQVCQGLYFAHNYSNHLTGHKAHIVHRDISPHNIMVTYDGSVKVIDFGIAKANTNSEATQAGTIKGKLSYLAPEYIEGKELDHRYDQFAVGITLWELLTGRKLFSAPNDLAVLKMIQECKILAPSKINPNISPELDEIVLKALSKDRNDRFHDMDQFNKALIRFLYKTSDSFSTTDLMKNIGRVFEEEIKKDRLKMVDFGKIDINVFLQELEEESKFKTTPPSLSNKNHDKEKTLINKKSKKTQIIDLGIKNKSPISMPSIKNQHITKTDWQPTHTISFEGEISHNKTTTQQKNQAFTHQTQSLSQDIKTNSSHSKTSSQQDEDQNEDVVQKPSSFLKVASVFFLLALGGFSYNYYTEKVMREKSVLNKKNQEQRLVDEKNKAREIAREKEREFSGRIILKNYDKRRDTVTLDNQSVQVDLLENFIKVKLGKKYVLRVETPGVRPFIQEISALQEGKDSIKVEIPEDRERMSFAFLSANSPSCSLLNGASVKIKIFDELREYKIPFSQASIPLSDEPLDIQIEMSSTGISELLRLQFNKEDMILNLCDIYQQKKF